MDIKLAKEIIDCLPKERTLYRYFKNGYAVSLLRRYLQKNGPQKVSGLRSSKVGKLLAKPVFVQMLQQLGKGELSLEHLAAAYPLVQESYVLTLDIWGNNCSYRWDQVSRRGANLVLQVNLNNQHDQCYRKYVADDFSAFKYLSHPVSLKRSTMAWARIDLDFERDEALIEEIQTDWLRYVIGCSQRCEIAKKRSRSSFYYAGIEMSVEKLSTYFAEMEKHQAMWSEAALNAAVNFVFDELGIRQLYYHAFDTGAVLKGIKYRKPPKSLYTELPRKFCFEKVKDGPEFIRHDKKAKRRLKVIKNPQWFAMSA